MDFLARCELPPQPQALAIACAVRCAIGKQAELTPDAIQAGDRIPEDLGDIFIQDSPDVIGFLMRLEEELNVRIPDSVALSVTHFADKETVTVKEIVTTVFSVLAPILSKKGSR
jgi:acyl carrier protein